MTQLVFAHTENRVRPGFVNLSKQEDGSYKLLVRTQGTDYPAEITLSREEVKRFADEINLTLSE